MTGEVEVYYSSKVDPFASREMPIGDRCVVVENIKAERFCYSAQLD